MRPEPLPRLPPEVVREVNQVAHFGKAPAVRLLLARAAERYEEDNAPGALKPLLDAKAMAPRSAAVRELLGLVYYRLEQWRDAARELSTYRRMSESRDIDHILADCERALGRPEKALGILEGLHDADLDEDVDVEARIVEAGALRDLGRREDAVAVLESGPVRPRLVEPHHLRLWYALADALEAVGRRVDAREWWDLVYAEEPDFFDVARRRLRRDSSTP